MDKLFRGTVPRNFERRLTVARGKDSVWQVDLIDFGVGGASHRGYIIAAIDQYDRRGWLQPINSKSAAALRSGMNAIFVRAGGKPDEIFADREAGLATLSDDDFPHVFHAGAHAALAEGFIKWTRNHLERQRDEEPGRQWRHLVAGLEAEYNNKFITIHTDDGGLKFRPGDQPKHLLDAHYAANRVKNFEVRVPFAMYDLVLLPNNLGDRELNFKGFHKNWNPQPWVVTLILHNSPLALAKAELDDEGRVVPGASRNGSVYPEQCKAVKRDVVIEYLKSREKPERAAAATKEPFTSIIQTRSAARNKPM